MSYINSGGSSGFSSAVISFWFRVPQESMDNASADYTGEDEKMLDGIVPLVVMGREGTWNTPTHTEVQDDVLTYTAGGGGTICAGGLVDIHSECTGTEEILPGVFCCRQSIITATYECNCVPAAQPEVRNGRTQKTTAAGPAPRTDPTFIGVDVSGGQPTLYVNFESASKPSVSGYNMEITGITPGTPSDGYQVGECFSGAKAFGCDVLCCVCLIIECSNADDNGNGYDNTTPSSPAGGGTGGTLPQNQYSEVEVGDDATGAIYSNEISVSADAWHHVLISVDLKAVTSHGVGAGGDTSGPIGDYVDSAAVLHIALDDKNYEKWDLSENWAEGRGPNDVITDGAYNVAGSQQTMDDNGQPVGGIPQYSLHSSAVPGGDVGMPATAKYQNNVYHVEMAEFQMWTGETLDTGDVDNRRAFLDFKPNDNSNRLRPVNPKVAAGLMGRGPDVLLHGSNKWKKGDNTGGGSDFAPTGGIETYKPDPSIPGKR